MDQKDLHVMLTTLIRLTSADDQATYVTKHSSLLRTPARHALLSRMYGDADRQGDHDLRARVERVMKLLDLADQFGIDLAASLVQAGPGQGTITGNTAAPLDDDTPDPGRLAAVAACVRRFRSGAATAPDVATDLEAAEAARYLAAMDPVPEDVALLLGWYHWARFRSVPLGAEGDKALAAALSHFDAAREPALSEEDLPPLVRDHLRASSRPTYQNDPYVSALLTWIDHLLNDAAVRHDLRTAQQALQVAKRCLASLDEAHPARAELFIRASLACNTAFQSGGGKESVDQAVDAARRALRSATGEIGRLKASLVLASALEQRFDMFRAMEDLHRAIDLCRTAVRSRLDGPLVRSHQHLLAESLQLRYEATGDGRDIQQALEELGFLLDAEGSDGPAGAPYLTSLAAAHLARYERTRLVADLNESISFSRRALSAAGAHPARCEMAERLSLALQARYERTGAPENLDEAIEEAHHAVRLARPGERRHARYLYGLLMALRMRYDLAGDPNDLDMAIAMGRSGPALQAAGNQRMLLAQQLGIALRRRHERTHDPKDLEEALALGRLACQGADRTGRERSAALNSLAHGLRLHDPERAEQTYQQAVDLLDPADPGRAAVLIGLGAARQDGGRPEAGVFREAANVATATTSVRLLAAGQWAESSVALKDWPEALRASRTAVDLLPRLAGIALLRKDQEEQLAAQSGLASTAAAVAVQAGEPGTAAVMLEQGRGILLSRTLDARTDVSALRERHKELAAEFEALCHALDQGGEDWSGTSAHAADRRHRLAEEWERVLDRIRAIPEFRAFLTPLSPTDITSAAAHGPIIMVNVSPIRSHALIVTSEEVRSVSLPDLTPRAVEHRVEDLLRRDDEDREQRLFAILGWLWDTVASPVLTAAGITRAAHPAGSGAASVPRVWWCPTGLLSLLPLHAAGHHDTRCDDVPMTVMDRAVSSYTPTVRSLLHARRPPDREPPDWAGHVLAVAMPSTPGATNIPGARREARLLGSLFGAGAELREGARNVRDEVLQALPRYPWAHFSCHGYSDVDQPSNSRLLLHDHRKRPLTVTDVARLRLGAAELAFLSACSTARTGTALADEAIHLVSAFQLAGYRHAIGTLWEIGDGSAVRVATDVYAALKGKDARNAALALHTAILERRAAYPDRPSAWAAHVHSGA
ncbi:CHAT domain-containing protein [Streptomyces sp. NPDC048723]|uniref:CHAT domain-containing protein n=1 Tax=Streptomyces sp. NPDC048723 TaxID=3365589 RepID=UPI00371FD747